MITKRIIPCLDVKDGRVVKGVNFAGLQDVSSPVELAEYYTRSRADELVLRHHRLRRGAGPVSRHSAPDGQPGVHSPHRGGRHQYPGGF